ncbi:MAG TPA: hypothetical protein VFT22_23955 [Kofleriaceae bacterium]|nr:hypothetical protein [Kofleriaceae bacterium]
MGRRTSSPAQIELGDFQTPPGLAAEVCRVLAARGVRPQSIVEPTCGTGSLLCAALDAFPAAGHAMGADIRADHIRASRAALGARCEDRQVALLVRDFFATDWPALIAGLSGPILFVGNPPWVTSSDLGALGSGNLPEKQNFHRRTGLDALTGKSNFDLSEWMLLKLLGWLAGREAVVAMLCKAAVARRALAFSWQAGVAIRSAATYAIDAAAHFGAAVEACLLVCELGQAGESRCLAYDGLGAQVPSGAFGLRDGRLVADVAAYDRWRGLEGESPYRWRSGIKHDCARVMELRGDGDELVNGDDERVRIEDDWLYPMLKSSEVAREGPVAPVRRMLVTQARVGEDTRRLEREAPRTWRYLMRHRERFERRASAIYRGKPAFSIFGVGDYTFAPWKVAISGLYKRLAFRVVGPHEGKPVVFDDTCYFVSCGSEAEARLVWSLVSSEPATELFESLVFWDAKRPITTELLGRLDLRRVAQVLGKDAELARFCAASPAANSGAPGAPGCDEPAPPPGPRGPRARAHRSRPAT